MKQLLVILFALGICEVNAQKPIRAPHGGEIKTANSYCVELVDCTSYVQIYLYELDMWPVRNHGISGSVDYYYPGDSCFTSPLYPYSIDSFTAEAKQPCYTHCQVFLHGVGLNIRVEFSGYEYNDEDCRPVIKIIPDE